MTAKPADQTQDATPASKWLPTLVTFIGLGAQLAVCSAWVGRLDQRVVAVERHAADTALHMSLDRKMELFVPRAEYADKVKSRDAEFIELRNAIARLDAKLDRLIERRPGE